jgi:hypothetical protein
MDDKNSSKGRLLGATNVIGTEPVSYVPRSESDDLESARWFRDTVLETPKGVLTDVTAGKDHWSHPPRTEDLLLSQAVGHRPISGCTTSIWRNGGDLGEADIHPDRDWDYTKPSWNPWFADSSRLAYFTHNNSVLSVSTPDAQQRTDIQIDGTGGLAAPSPDGHFIAYVRFEPRPRKERPDLQFGVEHVFG